jgi:putative ABC transport system permease protein
MLEALFLVLGVLGIGLLGLSAFLIVNTMNAIIVQQVWQVGMMKVLGATSWRVVRVYLSAALAYGLLALIPAIPLGVLSAYGMASWTLDTFNIIAPIGFRVSPVAIGVQVLMALAVALLAATLPVIGGARISPHQAISTYGLGGQSGRGPLDRLVRQARFLPRPVALSLRNLFRRKLRVALTLVTFVLVGIIFIAVLSARSSLHRSIEVMLKSLPHDVMVALPRYYRASRLAEVTASTPGVVNSEVWDRVYADLSLAAGKKEIMVFGVPPDSEAFRVPLVAGRYLLPGEGRAILLDSRTAMQEDIGIGGEVTLTIAGEESTWTVVGLIQDVSPDPNRDSAVPFDALTQAARHAGRGNTVTVTSAAHDAPSRERLATALADVYTAEHIETTSLITADGLSQDTLSAFDTLSYLLVAMAFLAAVVGSIGLMGTLSINLVERMREVGVVRAIGATSPDIVRIFVGEGLFLGVLSWLVATPLSLPGAYYLNQAIGSAFNLPVAFEYSLPSVAIWLVIVVLLSALASLWPARRATQISVQQALAYE